MPTIEDAIALAVEAHRGQLDKGGQPYILHPLRVMLQLESEAEKMVGILHDVVEDTSHTFDGLRSLGYLEEVLVALNCLTKRRGEAYEDFVQRIKPNPLARRVKLADLEDNLNVTRLSSLGEEDLERLGRYRKAWEILKQGS